MGDIIDITSKLEQKVNVELEKEHGQRLLESAIVGFWEIIGGMDLQNKTDDFTYHMFFLSFADVCFTHLEEGNIEVFEDGNVGVNIQLKEALIDGIQSIKEDIATNDNSTD